MSWLNNLTGMSGKSQLPPTMLGTGGGGDMSSGANNDNNGKNGNEKNLKTTPSVSQWSNFDPTGLERAAKAAKELERSKHAKDSLDLARIQEVTKQQEYQTKIKEREAYIEQMKIEKVKAEQDEKRRTLDAETQQYKQRANYQDQLSRKRHDDQLAQQQKMTELKLKKQEESVAKQEAMRKKTIDYEAKLKKENDMAVMEAKIRAQGKLKRETHDLEMEGLNTKLREYRQTTLEVIRTSANILGNGFNSFVNNPYQVSMVCGSILLMSLGLKSVKSGVKIASNYIESILGKPTLVRETSRFNRKEMFTHLKSKLPWVKMPDETNVMRGIFLPKYVEDQLIRISISTINTKNNNGYYRNLLFYGPPGTGKTLFAKSMAHTVGMDYAIMTGGDVAPLGKDAVTALHNVFKWAATSKKGLLLFIDEADAFLKKRNKEAIGEDLRNALNAFLYQTGESSKNFLLVLATNQPDHLDRAVNDRIDELVEFILPQLPERQRLLRYYFNKYITEEKIKVDTEITENKDQLLESIAKSTEGLSGREISKLGISWQASAYASASGTLTKEMLIKRTEEMSKQHTVKIDWETHQGENVDYLSVKN